jgi:hypothetical protein
MRRIQQNGETDCGVAALAMLVRRSLPEVRVFLETKGLKTTDVNTGAIIIGLKHFGREPMVPRSISVKDVVLEHFNHDALLSCYMWQNGKRYGHWAVWDARRRRVLDPYAPKQKLKIRAYLPVQ